MNEVSKQQLSALLDGDMGDQEIRFLLRRIKADPALAELWSRYLLIGDSLRKSVHVPASAVFVARVMQQIEDSPAVVRPGRPARWLRYGLGGGIAASVAVVALLWMQPGQQVRLQADTGHVQLAAAPAMTEAATATSAAMAQAAPDFSALMLHSRAPLLQVQPASAVIRQQPSGLGDLPRSPVQPIWMSQSMNVPRQTAASGSLDFLSILARRHAEPPRVPVARH